MKKSERRQNVSQVMPQKSEKSQIQKSLSVQKFIKDFKQEEKRHRTMVEGSESYDFGAWHGCTLAMLPIFPSQAWTFLERNIECLVTSREKLYNNTKHCEHLLSSELRAPLEIYRRFNPPERVLSFNGDDAAVVAWNGLHTIFLFEAI